MKLIKDGLILILFIGFVFYISIQPEEFEKVTELTYGEISSAELIEDNTWKIRIRTDCYEPVLESKEIVTAQEFTVFKLEASTEEVQELLLDAYLRSQKVKL